MSNAQRFEKETSHLAGASWNLLWMIIPAVIFFFGLLWFVFSALHQESFEEKYEVCRADAQRVYHRCSERIFGLQSTCNKGLKHDLEVCDEDHARRVKSSPVQVSE